ncbi:MAG TPA: hypothetical protein VEQ11_04745 [Chloroflexota bacterium]|nr:hypothetical protein [Chloroflexota bacterium]
MLQLSRPRYLGQFYGLYAVVGRFAAILGPPAIVDWLALGRPLAVFSLLVMVAISMVVLRAVPAAPHAWRPEEMLSAGAPAEP